MNMSFQDFSNWSSNMASMGKAFQPVLEMQKIGGTMFEQLARENLSVWSDLISNNVKCMQSANKINRPDELTRTLMAYFAEQSSRLLKHARVMMEISEESMQELTHSLQGRIDTAFAEQEQAKARKSAGGSVGGH